MDFRHFVTNQPIILTNWGKIKTKSPSQISPQLPKT